MSRETRTALFETLGFGCAALACLAVFVQGLAHGQKPLWTLAFGLACLSLALLTTGKFLRYRRAKGNT